MLISSKDLLTLKKFHASLIISSAYKPIYIASKLISLYAKFNDLDSAVSVFKNLTEPNTHIWNSIIKAHADYGLIDSAFFLYKRMRELGSGHDFYTIPIINQAVLLLNNSFQLGEMVHCLAFQMGFESDIYFCNTMIEVYGKCGCVRYARQVFDEMPHRDLVSWTSMISGYLCQGNVVGAFILFRQMHMELEPNCVTMMVMLQACSRINGSVIEGRQLHGYVMKKGFLIDRSVGNSVLKMYTNTGSCDDAEILFGEIDKGDVVSWNIMMSFFSLRGEVTKVTDCFGEMQCEVVPSIETFTLLISAFSEGGHIFQGKQIHCLAIKRGLCDIVLRTSLLVFYAKLNDLETSVQLFNEIPYINSITWSAMMSGFIHNGYFKEGVALFQKMLAAGVEPVADALRSLVVAYSDMGALQLGKGIHGYLIRNFFYTSMDDTALETSILNMYIRCGSISAARICFDRMVSRDLVTWTSMIEGCGIHGLGFKALDLFHLMVGEEIEPNSVTFLSVLSACSHSGLLGEGCEVFYSMRWRFGIEPDLNHYTSIVDLLGRSGKLKEGLAIIVKFVAFPDSRIWGALLAASRVYGDQKIGEYSAKKLLELEPDNAGYYTLLSNVQASVERWAEVEEVRSAMKEKEMMKQPGWSSVEAKGLIHGFVSGDRSHPRVVEIDEILGCLSRNMHDLGYGLYS